MSPEESPELEFWRREHMRRSVRAWEGRRRRRRNMALAGLGVALVSLAAFLAVLLS